MATSGRPTEESYRRFVRSFYPVAEGEMRLPQPIPDPPDPKWIGRYRPEDWAERGKPLLRFLRNTFLALAGGILFALALAVSYGTGYRHGSGDACEMMEEQVRRATEIGVKALNRPAPRPPIAVEEVPQK